MSEVSLSNALPVAPEKVWEVIGGFNAVPDWHPAVKKSELEEGGTVRRLSLVGGGEIVERLERKNDGAFNYSYSIMDSPLPVSNYTATIKIDPDGKGGCRVTWSSRFEPSGASENEAVKAIEGIYKAGFDNLNKMFGG